MADDKTNPPVPGPAAAATSVTGTTGAPMTTMSPGGRISTAVTTGTRIMGTYEIEQLISKGGMGEVYRGRNIHTGEPVAIKIVLPHLAQDEMIIQLFQKEAKVLGRLGHDAIVRYHVFTNDPEIGRPSLIMEFVEGTSMNERMKQGPMPEHEVRILLRRLASGLDRAHGVGVVHRDLSPDNVILEGGAVEEAKIIDFGIAKSSMKGDATLLQGQFAGKFSFVAPEQLGAFHGSVDARTDIYSLALMMVAACIGKNLNMGKSIVEAVRARNAVPDLSVIYPGLRPLLEHMLEPNPDHRPASMAEVIRLIDNPDEVPTRGAAEEEDPDRTRIVSAASLASARSEKSAPGGSAPKGSLPPAAPQNAASDMFVGIPSSGTAAKLEEKKGGKGGLIAALLVLAVAGGGAGAWFGGMFDDPVTPEPPVAGTTEPETPGTEPPGTGTTTATTEPAGTEPAGTEPAGTTTTAEIPTTEPTGTTTEPANGSTVATNGTGTEIDPPDTSPDPPPPNPTPEPVTPDPPPPEPPADPMERQAAWVRAYDPGACAYVAVRGTAAPAVALEGFGKTVEPFTALLSEFTAEHGTEPALDTHVVNDPQCPVIDYMKTLREAKALPPTLVLDNPTGVVKSGEAVAGRIEGLAGRAVSLFLVNGVGGATNLKSFLSKASDGTVSFSFSVNLAAGTDTAPQLLMALVTDDPVTKLDAVPNGVTARALIPFMTNEIERARQDAIADLRYFRLDK